MFGVIDRIEGRYAVVELENGNMMNIELKTMPKEAKEGHIIKIEDKKITIDYKKTDKTKEEIEKLMKDIFES